MTPPPASPPTAPGFWADLTGLSDRWGRTLLYAVLLGRLSLMAVGALLIAVYGVDSVKSFSGVVREISPLMIFLVVAVAPLVESLMLLIIVLVAGRLLKAHPAAVAFLSGALFVPLHGLTPVSLTVLPFFALMGLIQLNWMRRGRIWPGLLLVIAIHTVANALAVAAALALGPADL